MTAKELIEQLQKVAPDTEIIVKALTKEWRRTGV